MLGDDLEGWDGRGGGEAPEGGHVCVLITDRPLLYSGN